MNTNLLLEYAPLSSPENIHQLKQILAQCFNTPLQQHEVSFHRIGTDQFRIIRQADQVLGGLALLPIRQWWNKQRVSMAGITCLGIAPEHRDAIAAKSLLQHTLRELYTNGTALSALYTNQAPLYRQVGYEYGGISCSWQLPLTAIGMPAQGLPLHRIEPSQQEILRPLYQQKARLNNGHLERHPIIWQRFFQATEKEPVYVYVIGSVRQPEGYLIFSQQTTEAGIGLRIRDWAALTPEAGHSFWAFIAHHQPQVQTVRWRSSIIDPLAFYLPTPNAQVRRLIRWMLRIVHLQSALEQRGYPPVLQTELHLDIQDDLLSSNAGKWMLSVSNGRGQVTPGGHGEFKLDIRGLVPLYTGLLAPQQLQAIGQVQSTDMALTIATQLFAGVPPWMSDVF